MDAIMPAAQLIKESEGLSLTLYQCPGDKTSIGYGRNLQDNGISQNEAEYLLIADISRTSKELYGYKWYPDLDHVRQSALLDMHYNLGSTTFRTFKRMIFALENHDYVTAAQEMLRSRWATQYPGTRARAVRDARILRTGELT